jgi:hypothetical protein
MEDALWASLPGRIWPRSPGLGLILADGGWLRARPVLALAAPALAFLFGAFRGGGRPAHELTYGYSAIWLVLLVAVALAGCGLAVATWFGFVLGDLLVFGHPEVSTGSFFDDPTLWDQIRQFLLPHLVSYLLLAVLLVGTPLVALIARGSVAGLLAAAPQRIRVGLAAAAAAVAAAVHAGLWTQAYPLLIRPIWTWRVRQNTPDAAGISPVQDNPLWFALVAGVAAAGFAVLSAAALRRITGHRYQPVARPPATPPVRPAWAVAGALAKAVLVTLLIGGLIPSWRHGAVTVAVLSAAFVAQRLLLPRTAAARWWTAKLPAVLRLAVAAAVAWLVAWQIGRTAYEVRFGSTGILTENFDPLLWAVVAATACMALLLPAASAGAAGASGTAAPTDGGGAPAAAPGGSP